MKYTRFYSRGLLRQMYAEELASCEANLLVLPKTYLTFKENYLEGVIKPNIKSSSSPDKDFINYVEAFICTHIDSLSLEDLEHYVLWLGEDFEVLLKQRYRKSTSTDKYAIRGFIDHYKNWAKDCIKTNLDSLAEYGTLISEPKDRYFTEKRALRPKHVSNAEFQKACGKYFGKLGKKYGKLSGCAETSKENRAKILKVLENWQQLDLGKPTLNNISEATKLSRSTIKRHTKNSNVKEAKKRATEVYKLLKKVSEKPSDESMNTEEKPLMPWEQTATISMETEEELSYFEAEHLGFNDFDEHY